MYDTTSFQAFRDGLDSGSFREGLEGLRSDLVNKAVQHRALAKNISSDVLEPLSELKGQLSSKTKALVSGWVGGWAGEAGGRSGRRGRGGLEGLLSLRASLVFVRLLLCCCCCCRCVPCRDVSDVRPK